MALIVAFGATVARAAPPLPEPSEGVSVIAHARDIWAIGANQRSLPHPIRLEGRVNYADPDWHLLWMEFEGEGFFLPLATNAPALKAGQRVRLEGTFIPDEGLDDARIQVTVLDEHQPITPMATTGRLGEIRTFDRRVISMEAYVDDQQSIDSAHLRLWLIVEGRSVIAWVPPGDPVNPDDWRGRFVKLKALYTARIDPTGNEALIELWITSPQDITPLGDITTAARFDLPATPIGQIHTLRDGTEVRVSGAIQQRETGVSVTLRDDSGEILVRTLQRTRFAPGTTVEAVGKIATNGARWVVESALLRPHTNTPAAPASPSLKSIDEIRHIPLDEAAKFLPITIAGIVTWSFPGYDFFYLQDMSGGIRVTLPRGTQTPPPLHKALRINGVTCHAGGGNAVAAHEMLDLGAMSHPHAKTIDFDRAVTGSEDGQWVEMLGYLDEVKTEGQWRWLHLTTPTGPVIGHLRAPVHFVAHPGSLLRAQGVCETIRDAQNQITGVRLRIPFAHDIRIEQDAPADPFALPLRPIKSLTQLRALQELLRVRVVGTVLGHVPGEMIVVQEGDHGLRIYTPQRTALQPGDVVEAVGILGNEGARTLLRNAVYRIVKHATVPEPYEVTSAASPQASLDQRLVRLSGELVDSLTRPGLVRYTVQNGSTTFDAFLSHEPNSPPGKHPRLGSGIELTGIYTVDFDDARLARDFHLQLRDIHDVVVARAPRLWTLNRALLACGLLAGLIVLGLIWEELLRHRVRRQTAQIKTQLEKQVALESELERGQRLRSLGQLAGGIAHDFNNLLTGILGNLSLARLDKAATAPIAAFLDEAEKSARQASELTQQLVTFAQGGAPWCIPLHLPPILREAIDLALQQTNVEARFEPPADLWPINADPQQLTRAFQGLLAYARETMPQGGEIRIAASNETIAPSHNLPLKPGRYVLIEFADRSAGIDPSRLAALFDPYTTTTFGDTRFGLAIAYSIVQRHGGHLAADSELGQGTSFHLWVPAATEQPPQLGAPPLTPAKIAGMRVLLMDDDESIRRLGERILRRLGCAVSTATHGKECLLLFQIAQTTPEPFDVVILDLTVERGMGGIETLAELRKLEPRVRAIISSGFAKDPVMQNPGAHGFVGSVAKPYEPQTLAHALQLARPPQTPPTV
jgi:signal transduction histidine kinase/ActR/RegA family two-component response regulator